MERNPFEMERNRNNYQNQLYIRSIFPDYYRLNCFSLCLKIIYFVNCCKCVKHFNKPK